MNCPQDAQLFDPENEATRDFLDTLEKFRQLYAPIHGYICVGLCLFGIITNIVHVLVLSRPAMRNSAVNSILTAVAVCDIGTMGSYLIYIMHFVIQRSRDPCSPPYTYGWLQFLLWHVVLSITLHTTSLWLAVAMAFIRRMTLRVARLNRCPNYSPNYTLSQFTFQVSQRLFLTAEKVFANLKVAPAAQANNCRLFKMNIWMIGIVFKVIPCILLFTLSIGLVMKIHDAERHRRKLTNVNSNASYEYNNGQPPLPGQPNPAKKKSYKPDRTTVMLVAILSVFLITELPQGFISILCAIYTSEVHRKLYYYVGDVLDLLSLINSCVNFVLYCVMSSRYRHTFWTVVLPTRTYAAYSTWLKAATTPSNFSQLPIQRKNSSKR
ncbi:hypothetical protein WR25_11603 isoform B [Diploscapter pachys]|uniref:G-protein coupled receptors family 1 profile domain-containing protein n=2 Tax=Diploscapter pachys TaxID=2018661 RepID=A0A2A2KR57_9BILA|nr:hypothetical protein WR25_11603 isoform B [Diploscapter pachys]